MCLRAASCFLVNAASSARARGARLDEGVVVAGIERELAVFEMQDEFGGRVQQVAVMADDQNRAAIALEIILQPQHAFEIEIVGRLVEQQQIGRGEQDRGQRHAHAPAAGEFRAGAKLVLGRKAETRQDGRRARRRRIGVDRFQPGMDVAQFGADRSRSRLAPAAACARYRPPAQCRAG